MNTRVSFAHEQNQNAWGGSWVHTCKCISTETDTQNTVNKVKYFFSNLIKNQITMFEIFQITVAEEGWTDVVMCPHTVHVYICVMNTCLCAFIHKVTVGSDILLPHGLFKLDVLCARSQSCLCNSPGVRHGEHGRTKISVCLYVDFTASCVCQMQICNPATNKRWDREGGQN